MVVKRSVKPEEVPAHIFLRETLRHYLEFRDLVAHGGDHVLEHSYMYKDKDGEIKKKTISISFWDLDKGLRELAPRKREALWYNVILDQKQKDVAARMGITTVSVGQYTLQAVKELTRYHSLITKGDEEENPVI